MKLDKLKMPEKKSSKMFSPKGLVNQNDPSDDELNEGDMGEEGSPSEEANESPEEESKEGPNDQLESVSDDDLMAEIKKRGLMSKLQGEGQDSNEPADLSYS